MMHRYRFILETLYNFMPRREGLTSIDCSCGIGEGTLELMEDGFKVVAIDINKKTVETARKRGVVDAQVGDIRKLKLFEPVDLFVCSETLEHLSRKDSIRAAGEIKKYCKPNGFICITVPESEIICMSDKRHLQYLSADDVIDYFSDCEMLFSGQYWKTPKRSSRVLLFKR